MSTSKAGCLTFIVWPLGKIASLNLCCYLLSENPGLQFGQYHCIWWTRQSDNAPEQVYHPLICLQRFLQCPWVEEIPSATHCIGMLLCVGLIIVIIPITMLSVNISCRTCAWKVCPASLSQLYHRQVPQLCHGVWKNVFFFLFILKTIGWKEDDALSCTDCAPTFQPFVSLVGFGTFFYSNVFLNPWKQYVSQDINESMRCYCHEMNMMGCIHEALWVENPFALSLNPVRPCSLPGLSIVVSCRQWALSFQLLWEQLKYKWVVNVVNQNCQDRHKSNWKSHISKHKVTTVWKQLHCTLCEVGSTQW